MDRVLFFDHYYKKGEIKVSNLREKAVYRLVLFKQSDANGSQRSLIEEEE
jgi:hypothetical protein